MLRHLKLYEYFTTINEDHGQQMPTWSEVFEKIEYGEIACIDFFYEEMMDLKIHLSQRLRTLHQQICKPEDVVKNCFIPTITSGMNFSVVFIFDPQNNSKLLGIVKDPMGDIKIENVSSFNNLIILPAVNEDFIEDVCILDTTSKRFVIMEERNKKMSERELEIIDKMDLISRFVFGNFKVSISMETINIIDSQRGKRFSWSVRRRGFFGSIFGG